MTDPVSCLAFLTLSHCCDLVVACRVINNARWARHICAEIDIFFGLVKFFFFRKPTRSKMSKKVGFFYRTIGVKNAFDKCGRPGFCFSFGSSSTRTMKNNSVSTDSSGTDTIDGNAL